MKIINTILLSVLFSHLLLCPAIVLAAPPMTGNPHGNITLVEYYDIACPHCRRMASVLTALQKAYPTLRIVYRVTPLLTLTSRYLASIELAAQKQGHWLAVHRALMSSLTTATVADAQRVAVAAGVVLPPLSQWMRKLKIQQQLTRNIALAQQHAIQGHLALPIFVVGRSDDPATVITLTGERSYRLLAALIQQLEQDHVYSVSTSTKKVAVVRASSPRCVTKTLPCTAIIDRRHRR